MYAIFLCICGKVSFSLIKNGREKLAKVVEEKFHTSDVFFYISARSALYGLLKSLGFEPGSEVIITGFTCDVVPNAVIQAGLKPVYADIDSKTFCMSPESVRQRITGKSRVLLIQHTFGITADIESLLCIAREYSLYVVEDCAMSLGSMYGNKYTGTFGDASIFSFELSKKITSCRGGMLLINTMELDGKTKHRKYYETIAGQSAEYAINILFQLGLSGLLYRPIIFNLGKYVVAMLFKIGIFKQSTLWLEKQAEMPEDYCLRMSPQQAAILYRQWKRLDIIRQKSKELSRYYFDNLKNIVGLMPYEYGDESYELIRYPIIVDNRDALSKALQKNDLELGLWFTAPISSPDIDGNLFGYVSGSCPHAEDVAKKICNLPTNLRVKKKDADRIIAVCRRIGDL
jgi:dTDP-4-amino-4,6-dideoxygalactose transaminase